MLEILSSCTGKRMEKWFDSLKHNIFQQTQKLPLFGWENTPALLHRLSSVFALLKGSFRQDLINKQSVNEQKRKAGEESY